ncbi:hypothetical protein JCM1841_004579 [Sporobolomyces salmonicolor]
MATSTTSSPLPSPTLPNGNEPESAPATAVLSAVNSTATSTIQKNPDPSSGSLRWKGFVSGTLSGLTKLAVGHPFDTIKIRMQCSEPGTYKGPYDCLMRTVRSEGPRALYKGASAPAIGWGASDSLLMGSLHQYRLMLASIGARSGRRDDGIGGREGKERQPDEPVLRLSLGGHALAGAMAGWTVCTIITPIEHLKARLQMQTIGPKLYTGPIDCARQVVKANGVFGLYKGFGATLLFRSWFGMMFFSYEVIQRGLHRKYPQMKEGTINFIAGGMASNTFWLGSFPFDAIKNRLMTDSLHNPRYPSWASCARQIWSEGGVKALYRGFVPCLLRAFPTNASALFVWETTMRVLGAEKIGKT